MYLAKVHYKDRDSLEKLTKVLKSIIEKEEPKESIYICIGTSRLIFDSLGPIVGEIIKNSDEKLKIYGLINDNIHAENFYKKIKKIKSIHKDSNIIVIDACSSNTYSIGSILIKEGSVKPGAGVGKNIEEVGNYSILGVIGLYTGKFDKCLYNTELSFIKDLAEVISLSILLANN